jgi:hypothetical protein
LKHKKRAVRPGTTLVEQPEDPLNVRLGEVQFTAQMEVAAERAYEG